MPKRIIIVNLCDVCFADDEKETNSTWSETITFGKLSRVLMLCDRHRKELIGNLPEVLARIGVKPEPVTPKSKTSKPAESPSTPAKPTTYDKKSHRSKANPLACQFCEFVAHNGTGLSAHQRAKHNEELESLNGAA